VQVALRTQQIIAEESGVADSADPLGGSHYIEYLTSQIESEIFKYLNKIEGMGGSLEAIKRGYIQKEITRSAYEYQKAVDSGEQVVVGVNKYTTDEEPPLKLLEIDEKIESKQIANLKRLKEKRDSKKLKDVLDKVQAVARSDGNIMPVLIEAIKSYATVGEISDSLREVFGEYRQPSLI